MGMLSSAGAGKAAEQQAKMMKEIARGYGKLTKRQYEEISPWMQAGKGALTAQMQMLANPINSQAALSTFYSSPDDGDKTRELINSIDRPNLSRQLAVAENTIVELRQGREHDHRALGIEIQMTNNQNQNQLQFQAQAQGLNFLQHGLLECNQIARATNQNVLVGNTGATATGPQTANPTNVKV